MSVQVTGTQQDHLRPHRDSAQDPQKKNTENMDPQATLSMHGHQSAAKEVEEEIHDLQTILTEASKNLTALLSAKSGLRKSINEDEGALKKLAPDDKNRKTVEDRIATNRHKLERLNDSIDSQRKDILEMRGQLEDLTGPKLTQAKAADDAASRQAREAERRNRDAIDGKSDHESASDPIQEAQKKFINPGAGGSLTLEDAAVR